MQEGRAMRDNCSVASLARIRTKGLYDMYIDEIAQRIILADSEAEVIGAFSR